MYKKSDRVLTLEKQLGKIVSESRELYHKNHINFEKRKMKIAEIFLDSIKDKLNLDYSVNSEYSGFNVWNEKFQARIEVKLDEVHNYSKMKSTYKLVVVQSCCSKCWSSGFSEFKVEENDKNEVGKFFFLKDYLTIIEEVTLSNVYSDLKDLFLEIKNESRRIYSIYGQDIQNLTMLIKEENEKTINSLRVCNRNQI